MVCDSHVWLPARVWGFEDSAVPSSPKLADPGYLGGISVMLELTCTRPVSVTSMDTKLAGKGQPGKTRGCFECLLDAGAVGGWAQLEEKGRSLKACAS